MTRGTRIVQVSRDFKFTKFQWLALWRTLPDDARIEDIREDFMLPYTSGRPEVIEFLVSSDVWDPVPENERTPFLIPVVRFEDAEAERVFGRRSKVPTVTHGQCICDFPYTGLRQHKSTCPKFSR